MTTNRNNPPDDAPDPATHPRLAAALRATHERPVRIPPAIDEAILAAARRRLGRRPQTALLMYAAASVAAGFIISLLITSHFTPLPPRRVAAAPGAREDVNRDGRVDILDAFALARRLRDAAPPGPGWDLNKDGKFDRGDVDMIAMAAVRVPERRAR